MKQGIEQFFGQSYRIGYRGLDAGLRTSAAIIMELMQETGTRHTDSTAFPMQWHVDNSVGFIITNLALTIKRQPKLGETVTVRTAPVSFKNVFAERFYLMTDQTGATVAESYTVWVLIDLINRKPVRIPAELAESYGVLGDGYSRLDTTVSTGVGEQLISFNEFRAPRRDADANMHINNIAYVTWAQEYIPSDTFGSRRVMEVRTRYKKECRAGDNVHAQTYRTGEGRYLTTFLGDGDARMADVETIWDIDGSAL